jgi:asparagine synthase (glutamine-hydrolysing)
MRGFAGLVHWDGKPVDRRRIDAVAFALSAGGKVRPTVRLAGAVGMVHLLQPSTPEDAFEVQPLHSSRGDILLVTDALLESRDELTAALGRSPGETADWPDSAFVLAAFEKWGDRCVNRLEGRFALAVWHAPTRRLFFATDALGFRPIYYWQRGTELAFASTLEALFALPEISQAIDEVALVEQFVGLKRVGPETIYHDVRRVPGGHVLAVENGRASGLTRYWRPDPRRVLKLGSDGEYLEAFRQEFRAAVARAVQRTSGGVGVYVSGGLDSAAVTAVAGQILAEQGRRLQAIHILPAAGNRYVAQGRELDESRFVAAMQAQAPHIDFHFTTARTEPATLEEWSRFFARHHVPCPGLLPAPWSRLRELTDSLGLELLLSGLGGNLLVSLEARPSGYLEYLAFTGRWLEWWRETSGHGRHYGVPLRALIRGTVVQPARQWWRVQRRAVDHRGTLELLTPACRARTAIEDRLRDNALETLAPWRDFRGRLHRALTLGLAQQTGAAVSVIDPERADRVRDHGPLFDRRFNEFCLSLPFDQQVRGGMDRRLMRESMRGLLPAEVRLRTTRGFPQPEFQTNFRRMAPIFTQEVERFAASPAVREILDCDLLRRRWEAGCRATNFKGALVPMNGVALGLFLAWRSSVR